MIHRAKPAKTASEAPTDAELARAIPVRVAPNGTAYLSSTAAAFSPRQLYDIVVAKMREKAEASS